MVLKNNGPFFKSLSTRRQCSVNQVHPYGWGPRNRTHAQMPAKKRSKINRKTLMCIILLFLGENIALTVNWAGPRIEHSSKEKTKKLRVFHFEAPNIFFTIKTRAFPYAEPQIARNIFFSFCSLHLFYSHWIQLDKITAECCLCPPSLKAKRGRLRVSHSEKSERKWVQARVSQVRNKCGLNTH